MQNLQNLQNHEKVQNAKEKFDNVVLNDPIKLSRYAKNQNEAYKRYVYILMVAIPLLVCVAFVFYSIASVDGAMFGTPRDELDTMISERMRAIIQQEQAQADSNQNKQAIGDTFEKIQLGMKLVPNMDQHNFLLKRMSMVGGPESEYDGLDEGVEYDMDALGDYSNYPYFFEWNGAAHVNFPNFKFDADHVPMGDSVRMCMGLSWTTLKKRNQFDKYINVRGFDECQLHKEGRSQWEADYPVHGLNFYLWDQHAAKGDTTCADGIYVPQTNICFTYHIMKQICLLVRFEKDVEKNTYSWIYTGGCFAENKPVLYELASPGEFATFRDVQFEVRLDHRNAEQVDTSQEEEDYESQIESEEIEQVDENGDAVTNSTLSPAARIKQQRDALNDQADNGELKTSGYYVFYHIFMFIGGLALLLAVICVGILIFLVLKLMKPDNAQDQHQLIQDANTEYPNQFPLEGASGLR